MNNSNDVIIQLITNNDMEKFKEILDKDASFPYFIPYAVIVYIHQTEAWDFALEIFRRQELLLPEARRYIRETMDYPINPKWDTLKDKIFLPLLREHQADILVGLGMDNALAACEEWKLLQCLEKYDILEQYCAWPYLASAFRFFTLIKHQQTEFISSQYWEEHDQWCARNCDKEITPALLQTHPWTVLTDDPIPEEWLKQELKEAHD